MEIQSKFKENTKKFDTCGVEERKTNSIIFGGIRFGSQ
jgi:hypothetical protein